MEKNVVEAPLPNCSHYAASSQRFAMGLAKAAVAGTGNAPWPLRVFSIRHRRRPHSHLSSFAVRPGHLPCHFSRGVQPAGVFRGQVPAPRLGTTAASRRRFTAATRWSLAWTVIPVLIVVVLFLATARVIHAVEDARFPPGATEVTARRSPVLVGVSISGNRDSLRPMNFTSR